MTRQRLGLLATLALIAVASRLLPHPDNVTPTAAVALFVAATFPGIVPALIASVGTILLGDLVMELTFRAGWQSTTGLYPGQMANYACMLPAVGFGLLLRSRRTLGTVAAATLANTLVFFLASNFVYFYAGDSLYPRNLAGLMQSYEMAVPFLAKSLAGDVLFSTALFGSLAVAEARFPALRPPVLAS